MLASCKVPFDRMSSSAWQRYFIHRWRFPFAWSRSVIVPQLEPAWQTSF